MQLKTIDLSERTFTANGTKYFIESEISIQRAAFAEMAKIELETGMQAGKWIEDWVHVYELCNQQKLADVAVIAYNNRKGFKNFFDQPHPILKLCCCFVNTENEDRRTITDDMVDKKINDFAEEGLSMSGFFALALTFLKIEVENLRNSTQIISELIKEYNEKMSAQTMDMSISN